MLTILCLLVVFVSVLLAIPLDFVFAIQHEDTKHKEVGLIWLLGLVRLRLVHDDKEKDEESTNEDDKNSRKSTRFNSRKAISILCNADLRRRLVRYVGRLIRAIRIRTLDVRLRLGLDDPADTGRLWGAVGPLAATLAGLHQANVSVEPDFTGEMFTMQSHGRVRIIPLEVISVSVLFFLSPQVIYALAAKT